MSDGIKQFLTSNTFVPISSLVFGVSAIGGGSWWASHLMTTQEVILEDLAEIKEWQTKMVTMDRHISLMLRVDKVEESISQIQDSRFTPEDAEALFNKHLLEHGHTDEPAKIRP